MKAVWFESGSYKIIDMDKPEPKKNEALVKVLCAGICNTDIELYRGYYGFSGVPGHEFVGVVEKSPDYPELEGSRVVADINMPVTPYKGDPRHAAGREVLGIVDHQGTFAEYVCIPLNNLFSVPDGVTNLEAVFAEPLAAGLEPCQQIHFKADDRVLVLGDGKLGILSALGLKTVCPSITLAGKHDSKLKIAADQGIGVVKISDPENVFEHFKGQELFDYVIEATGSEKGLSQALDLVRPEGTIVAKTTSHKPSTFNLARLVVDEIKVIGSRCGNIGFALSHLEGHCIDVTRLIEAEYPFSNFAEAFELALLRGSLKVVLHMS